MEFEKRLWCGPFLITGGKRRRERGFVSKARGADVEDEAGKGQVNGAVAGTVM